MDKFLRQFVERGQKAKTAQELVDESYAEEMGYDAGKNGPNETNSHFAIFSTRNMTDAWERGKRRAELGKVTPGDKSE